MTQRIIILTHLETVSIPYFKGVLLKIILNVKLSGILFIDLDIIIFSYDEIGRIYEINFEKFSGKKQYDGTYIITLDISKIKCYDYIHVINNNGDQFVPE